ncbi:hypothetical protein [Rhodospirillum sp. A1_3_36]|uniref:hypothetical protein n=1 Tax=Rhodospirillum sp. A1_3_36 TaxID=3391666 RepID=UPI0039A53EA4
MSRPTIQSTPTPFDSADRLVVSLIRRRAAGCGLSTLAALVAKDVPPGTEEGVAKAVFPLVAALDDERGPEVQLRPVPCRHIGPDERIILRLLSVLQAGDLASAHPFAEILVQTTRREALLCAAERLVQGLTQAGLRLIPSAPPPSPMAWFPTGVNGRI